MFVDIHGNVDTTGGASNEENLLVLEVLRLSVVLGVDDLALERFDPFDHWHVRHHVATDGSVWRLRLIGCFRIYLFFYYTINFFVFVFGPIF